MAAATVLGLIPVLILFLSFQKTFIAGMTSGAGKALKVGAVVTLTKLLASIAVGLIASHLFNANPHAAKGGLALLRNGCGGRRL